MLGDLKPVLGGHRVLDGFKFRGVELDDLAALGTDHVIVVLMFVVMLVMRATVAEPDFARESCFGQEFQCAINGRLPNAGILFLHEPVEVFVGEMFFGTQKNIQNQVTLRSSLQPFPLDVFKKDFLLFSWFCLGHQC